MKIFKYTLFVALMSLLTSVQIYGQNVDDMPKMKEIKGKKLLEEITPRQHKNGLWGYANQEGKFTIKPVFTSACPYEGKIARVEVEGKWGTISNIGLYVVTPLYDKIEEYSADSLAVVSLQGKQGLISAQGWRVQKVAYDTLIYVDYGYISKVDDKYGTIDKRGETILEPQFLDIAMLDRQRGLEQVLKDGKWGILKNGREMSNLKFDEKISFLQSGSAGYPDLYLARQNGKVGVVTSYGQHVVPCVYDEITLSLSGEYYVTRYGDKFGAVSLKMTELVPPILDSRPNLGEDIFRVHNDGDFRAVNVYGSVSFDACSDLFFAFRPDDYASTTEIPEWSKNMIIEENLADRQKDMDAARLVNEIMENCAYNPSVAEANGILPKGIPLSIPAGIREKYGICDGGSFVRSTGTVTDYESGYYNLHYKARTDSGMDVCLVSVPSTGEYLLTVEGEQFPLKSALEKFNVKEFGGIYPKDCAILPDDRLLVRFAFIRPGVDVNECLVETDPYYLPVMPYPITVHKGQPSPSIETDAVITFSFNSLAAVSFTQLPKTGESKMSASVFGGFFVHTSGPVIIDDSHPLKRFDRNGILDWEFRPRDGESFYDIEETENYVYLCGSTKNSTLSGIDVPFIVQLSKRGQREKEVYKEYEKAYFTRIICQDYLIYAKASFQNNKYTGTDFYPHFVLEDLGDNFGVRHKCVWEEWGNGIIGGCGLISHEGKWLNTPILHADQMCTAFDWEFGGFASDHLIIRHMGCYGMLDKSGEMVVEAKYDLLEVLENPGYVKAAIDDLYGVIDVQGKVIVPLEYDYVGRMSEDIIVVRKDGMYGCFDKTGKLVVPLEYEEIREYAGGMSRIRFIGKFGFIDKKGEFLVAPFSDEVENFKEDCCLVTIKDKVGLVTLQGDWIVAPMYDAGGSFSGGYAYLAQSGKYGFINKKGEFVIPMKYSDAKDFNPVYGLACVAENGYWGVIDVRGNYVVPATYDNVVLTADGYICAEKDGKFGIFSSSGRVIYPVVCDRIEYDTEKNLFRFGTVNGRLHDQRIRIDKQGNTVWQYALLADQ